jgi:hypothetical protein
VKLAMGMMDKNASHMADPAVAAKFEAIHAAAGKDTKTTNSADRAGAAGGDVAVEVVGESHPAVAISSIG